MPGGNIMKGDKDDVKKLKREQNQILNAVYDNRDVILANIEICEKNKKTNKILNV